MSMQRELEFLLEQNQIIKEDLERYKEAKLSPEAKCKALLDFVEKNKRVPKKRESHNYKGLEVKVGQFYAGIKLQSSKEL